MHVVLITVDYIERTLPGHIPTGAVQGGYNDGNDPLYIGRARHEDSFAVGKVTLTVKPTFGNNIQMN